MDYIDPVRVSPRNYRVLLENDDVRVLHMKLKAGEKDNQHSHPSETAYFIRGGEVRIHLPDGEVTEFEIPDGKVLWANAWTHSVENVGTTDIEAILVESKH